MSTGITDIDWLDAKVVETAKMLGEAEYNRDKYKRALERIIKLAESRDKHSRNFGGPRDDFACGEAEGSQSCAIIAIEALTQQGDRRE
jgi:hypothetical protein